MAGRNYSNLAGPRVTSTSLSASAPGAVEAVTLASSAGLPTPPFTASLERGVAYEELVLVTALASGIATITRGYDGTAAVGHSAGVQFEHCVASIDYAEANTHINTATGVHGITGSAVGTGGAQTLDSKTLTKAVASAGAANPAVELRRYDADTTKALVKGTDQAGATTLWQVDGTGKLGVPAITDPTLVGTVLSFDTQSAYFDPPTVGTVPVVIRAKSGQTANLVNIRDGSAALKSWYTSDARGVLAAKSSVGGALSVGSNIDFAVFGVAVGDIPLGTFGVPGQTEDLFAMLNDPTNNTRMAGVKSDGRIYAPAIKLSISGAQSANTNLLVALTPSANTTNYLFGTSLRETQASDGWPNDGLLETHRYTNQVFQRLLAADGRTYWRTTTTVGGTTWGPWRGGQVGYGELAYQETTTDETTGGGGTGLRDLPLTHATFTLFETRVVTVTLNIPVAGTSGDSGRIRLTNSSNVDLALSGRVPFTGTSVLYEAVIRRRISLAAGSYDWRARIERASGSAGVVWMPAATTTPGYIRVEDAGFAA